jgi:hypothetical protein
MNVILHICFQSKIANENKSLFNMDTIKEAFSLKYHKFKLNTEKSSFDWKEYLKEKRIENMKKKDLCQKSEKEIFGDELEDEIIERIYLPCDDKGNYKGYGFIYYRPCISGEIVFFI